MHYILQILLIYLNCSTNTEVRTWKFTGLNSKLIYSSNKEILIKTPSHIHHRSHFIQIKRRETSTPWIITLISFKKVTIMSLANYSARFVYPIWRRKRKQNLPFAIQMHKIINPTIVLRIFNYCSCFITKRKNYRIIIYAFYSRDCPRGVGIELFLDSFPY